MRTTRIWTVLMAAILGLGMATPAGALTQAEEAAYAVLATGSNIFYLPAKALVAIGSIPVGGMAGVFSGGDMRTAYASGSAMGGTYFLTNGHLDGSKRSEFFGADEGSPRPTRPEAGHSSTTRRIRPVPVATGPRPLAAGATWYMRRLGFGGDRVVEGTPAKRV